MYIELAKLELQQWDDTITKTLEDAGFTIIELTETFSLSKTTYIIAKKWRPKNEQD